MFRIVLIVLAFEFAIGSEPERVVSEFHDELLSSMKSDAEKANQVLKFEPYV